MIDCCFWCLEVYKIVIINGKIYLLFLINLNVLVKGFVIILGIFFFIEKVFMFFWIDCNKGVCCIGVKIFELCILNIYKKLEKNCKNKMFGMDKIKVFNGVWIVNLINCGIFKLVVWFKVKMIIEKNKMIIIFGIKELNDVVIVGGIFFGILILKFFIFVNLINNFVLIRVVIIVVVKLDEEVSFCKKIFVVFVVFLFIKVIVFDKGIKINIMVVFRIFVWIGLNDGLLIMFVWI